MRLHTPNRFILTTLLAIGVVCAIFGSFSVHSQDNDPHGQAEVKKGDYEAAIKILTARLNSNANDAVAQRNLLRAFIETGRYVDAEASAKKFLLKSPEAGAVRHELAEVFSTTGRYTEAVTEFERAAADREKASATGGDFLESALRRAEVLELIGQQESARRIYESCVKYYTDKDPKRPLN